MSASQEVPNDCFKNITVDKSNTVEQAVESNTHFFGPVLPPQLLKKQSVDCKKIYGPILPDNFVVEEKFQSDSFPLSDSDSNGKILIGPELPEYFKSISTSSEVEEKEEDKMPHVDNCLDYDDYGPSTTLMATGNVAGYCKIKSAENKSEKGTGDSSVKRETWMIELPQKKAANFGLLPRHFKARIQTENESDNSVWTSTPADRERKQNSIKKKDHKDILKLKRLQERDKEMEKLARKAAKKLKKRESLMEMHLKNMKKKKKEEAKKRERADISVPTRRPFDRNVDLQIRKFDESHKRAILNKSQFLNHRFASGESKFL